MAKIKWNSCKEIFSGYNQRSLRWVNPIISDYRLRILREFPTLFVSINSLTKLMYTFGCPRAPPPKNNNKSCINIVVEIYSWFKLYSLLFLSILVYDNEFETNNNNNVIHNFNQKKKKHWTTRYTLNSVTRLVHSLKTCFCFKHQLESEAMPEQLICFHQGVWEAYCM